MAAGRPGSTLAILALCLLAACATAAPAVVRSDWVLAPTRSGGHEVVSRGQYTAEVAHHQRHRAPNREPIPPRLLEQPDPILLQPGQVRAFLLVDEPVREMRHEGASVQVYWTTPYFIDRMEQGRLVEHRGTDVYLQAVSPGETRLELLLTDGSTRVLRLDVSGRPTG